MFKKFSFDNVKIGDKVLTTNNEIGIVVALKSLSYLNDKLQRKADKNPLTLMDLNPFLIDDVRHKGIWYSTVTIAVLDKTSKYERYYLEGIDFMEISKILHKDVEQLQQHTTLLQKIKNLFIK